METFAELLIRKILETLEDFALLSEDVSEAQQLTLVELVDYELAVSGRA